MRRATMGIAFAIALTLALGGCQPTTAPPPAQTPPTATETPTTAAPPVIEATPTEQPAPESPTPEATPTAEEAEIPTAEATPTAATTETPAAAPVPTVDGAIAEEEYPNSTTIGTMRIWWHNDGEMLTMALEAPAEGWVGVGLDPDNGMQGADFKLAAVLNGETRVTDAWGLQPTGPTHPADTELGGTDDILESAVVSENGVTRFEFRMPLDSGDEFDKPLEPGETYAIIVAYAGSNEYNAYHTFRQMGEITLDPGP